MFIVPFVRGAFCHLFNKRILDWIQRDRFRAVRLRALRLRAMREEDV